MRDIKFMEVTTSSSPGRRKYQPQYLRSPASATQPPWNTARCNRLIRPLSSKIASLRKSRQYEIQRGRQNGGPEPMPEAKRNNPPCANTSLGENSVLQSSKPARVDDQEWVPSPVPRKRIKRTYSSKDGGQVVRRARAINDACEPSLLDDVITQMPDFQDPSIDRQRQAFLRIMGSNPTNGEEQSDSGARAQCPKSSYNTHGPSRESFWEYARFIEPEHWKLINGLYNALDTLLRATEKHRVGMEQGARSLFSTCLRKIPDYIAEEQLRSTPEDPENVDLASLVYGDLEALGTSPAAGWKPLREVGRAHGVFLLGGACKEGLLNASLARGLMTICLHYHAYDEAQHLVECIISSMKPLRKSQAIPKRLFTHEYSDELSTLKYFVTASGRFHVLYRQLANLFTNLILPIECISSPGMVECWNGVIWSITHEDEHARAAIELLQTIIPMAYGEPCLTSDPRIHELRMLARSAPNASTRKTADTVTSILWQPQGGSGLETEWIGKAPSSVISNMLTVLCAVGLLGHSTSDFAISPRKLYLTVMQDLALSAHQTLTIAGYHTVLNQAFEPCAERICLLLLAPKLLEGEVGTSDEKLAPDRSVPLNVIAQLGCNESLPNSAASFLCAVARCCERATSVESFDYLQSIVQKLRDISVSQGYASATRTLVNQLAIAAAFEYSEETNNPKHLDWALNLEQTITGTSAESIYRTPSKTPSRKPHKSRAGYRWEEGICEWVAKTPATLWSKPESFNDPNTSLSDSKSDDDCTATSASPTRQGLLGLLQASPWSTEQLPNTDHVTIKGHSHLTKASRCTFQKYVGKYSQAGETIKTIDELQTSYRDSISPNLGGNDSEDELSTPNCSQNMPTASRPKLCELTNIGASIQGKRATRWKQRSAETCKRRARCHSTKARTQRPIAGPLKVDDSGDELSTLTC